MTSLDLSVFEGLQHGWDGYGAIAPDLETIENLRRIANHLDWPPFDISPDTNGCLSLESDTLTATEFHLQVGISRWSMYVQIGQTPKITYYTEGEFGVDDFPFSEVQTALDYLK